MNTRAAGRGTTTAGIAATTDAVTTVAAAGARGRQGTTRDVIYQPGYTLTKSATFPENRTTSVSRSLTGSSTVPFHRGGRCFVRLPVSRSLTGSSTVPVHREGGSRQRMNGPGTMSHPALWTCPACGRPLHRRAESGGRRGGRPQAVGNLAGERRRPCLRTGREIPTVPQRIIVIIDIRVRTGLVPTVAAAGQCRSRGRRGRDFAIGIHLNQALELSKPPGPRHRYRGEVGSDPPKTLRFSAPQVFFRHTCRVGSLPSKFSLAGRPTPPGASVAPDASATWSARSRRPVCGHKPPIAIRCNNSMCVASGDNRER